MNNILYLRFIFLLLISLFIIKSPYSTFAQESYRGVYLSKSFTYQDYNAGSQNWKASLGADGSMYFANNFGLLEFDGKYWNLHKTGYASNNLKTVLPHKDGRIYIGGQGDFGYFEKSKNGKLSYTSIFETVKNKEITIDEVWAIYNLGDEELLFCSYNYLFKYSKNGVEVIKPNTKIHWSFYVNGKVYASGWNDGLLIFKQGKFVPVEGGSIFKEKLITSIISVSTQMILITTLEGEIYKYDGETFTPWALKFQQVCDNLIVNSLVKLRNGTIAVATHNSGVYILKSNGTILDHLDKGKGLKDRVVMDIYEEKSGNLWVMHNNGISYVERGSSFSILGENSGLIDIGYTAKIDGNRLFLGTSHGLFEGNRNSYSNQLDFRLINGTQGQSYIMDNVDGELLFGQHKGAFRIEGNNVSQISKINGGWNFQEVKGHKDYMLQGCYTGILLHKKVNGKWQYLRTLKGFNESSRLIEQTDDGTIWMSHGYKGVYKMRLNAQLDSLVDVKFYNKEHGFPSNILINMFRINNRLVFCAEKGVYKYDEAHDRFILDPLFDGILGHRERVSAMAEDHQGNVYFIEKGELGYIKFDKFGKHKVERDKFKRINHLVSDDLECVFPIDSRNVLITSKEGFIHYNPQYVKHREKEFIVSLRSVQSWQENQKDTLLERYHTAEGEETYTITLPYHKNNLSFQFVTPFFDETDFISYQFLLENQNEEWSDWSPKTYKEYSSLREGNYTFKVRAKNMTGEISAVTAVKIIVLPPWYRSPLAYIIYTFVIAGILLIGYLIIRSRYQHKQEVLIEETQLQLNEKESQIKTLKEEKLKAEIEHKNRELTLSDIHLQQKNEVLSTIRDGLQNVLKSEEQKAQIKEVKTLLSKIDKEITQKREWERFEEHFNLIHDEFFIKLKEQYPELTTQECRICAHIKLNMSTKDIANLLNMSVRGVETSRYRIRKKFQLEKSIKLNEFIYNI